MTLFYHDTKHDVLIYPASGGQIEQYVPDAKPLNGAHVAVPRNLHNLQILRWLNYPVPAIITDENYDWPITPGKTPLPHQKVMANFFVLHRRAFNLSDPGTMKTLPALWACDWLMRQHPPGKCRALIVAPLTILETVWESGIFGAFLGTRTVAILHGSQDKRRELLAKKTDFAIINYDGVGVGAHTRKRLEVDGFCKELRDDTDIQIVIADEADNYCDSRTKRHRLARQIIGTRPYFLEQTGTPTSQAPTDAYGMAKLINNAYGKSFDQFRQESMIKISNFKWVPQKDGYDKARALLTPAIRYRIEEIWIDAPELLPTQQRMVQLTDEQKKLLNDLKRDLQVTLKNGQPISAINEGALRQKFLQIALGAIYDASHAYHRIDSTPRLREIEYLIGRTPRKVLLFACLTSIVEVLYKELSKKWKCGVINGNVSGKERNRLIHAFETDPDLKIMIMDPQPTAHGINEFVVADTVIWNGPTEKTRLYIQGNHRAHRPGQKFPVSVYQIVATKLEQEIFKRLETNTSLQGVLLEAVRRGEL